MSQQSPDTRVAPAPRKESRSLAARSYEPEDLFRQTLRTIAILVAACVLFVGALSGAAVAITHKAMGAPSEQAGSATRAPEPAAAPSQPSPKKPVSI